MPAKIEIDPELLARAMKDAGLSSERKAIEEGLRVLIRRHRQRTALANLGGLGWEGDLDEMRRGRPLEHW